MPRILIADDQADVLAALSLLLKGERFQIESAASPEGVLRAIDTREFDVVLIDQALTNIVENAARFTPPGRRITIGAGRWRDGGQVRIADRGPGIPREERGASVR